MSVIPRSHNELLAHARDSVSNHFITCEEDAWYRQAANTAVPAVMKAGGVIFFSYNTAHSTGDNRSLHERAGLAFHVGPASLHDAKPEQPMVYPGAEGEGNQSAAQQDNEVIKILQAKSTKKESEGQGQVESFGADEAQAAAEQLELLLDAGNVNPLSEEEQADADRVMRKDATVCLSAERVQQVSGGQEVDEEEDSAEDLFGDERHAGLREEAAKARRWLTGPQASGGEEYYGERIEGTWETEVSRALEGSATSDWEGGRIGSEAQREMIAASCALVEKTFGRQPSSSLPPAGVAAAPMAGSKL